MKTVEVKLIEANALMTLALDTSRDWEKRWAAAVKAAKMVDNISDRYRKLTVAQANMVLDADERLETVLRSVYADKR
jgi:hypothetical protein